MDEMDDNKMEMNTSVQHLKLMFLIQTFDPLNHAHLVLYNLHKIIEPKNKFLY